MLDDKFSRLRADLAGLGRVVVACSGGVDSCLLGGRRQPGARPSALVVIGRLAGVPGRGGGPGRRRWPPSTASGGGRWRRRSWPGRLRGQRRRPLLPLPQRAVRRAGARRRRRGTRRGGGGGHDRRRPLRPPAGPAGRRRAGRADPLADAGFTKADVRAAARRLGLAAWDKPAAACLASRIPYGTPVTLGRSTGSAGPRRRCGRWASPTSGSATTATSPGSRYRWPTWPGCWSFGRRWWPR